MTNDSVEQWTKSGSKFKPHTERKYRTPNGLHVLYLNPRMQLPVWTLSRDSAFFYSKFYFDVMPEWRPVQSWYWAVIEAIDCFVIAIDSESVVFDGRRQIVGKYFLTFMYFHCPYFRSTTPFSFPANVELFCYAMSACTVICYLWSSSSVSDRKLHNLADAIQTRNLLDVFDVYFWNT